MDPLAPGGAELIAQLSQDDRWIFERAQQAGQPLFVVPPGEVWLRVTFTAGAPAR